MTAADIGAIHRAFAAPVVRRFNPNPHPMPRIDLSPEGMRAFDASGPEQSAYISTTVAVAWFVPALVCLRALRADGSDSEGYATSMRRMLPAHQQPR